MTPIPPGLARPLVESLECDAVMRNSDIDSDHRAAAGRPDRLPARGRAGARTAPRVASPIATWFSLESEPAEALPSDPDWAGEIVYTDVRTAATATEPDDVWQTAEEAVERQPLVPPRPAARRSVERWHVAERDPAAGCGCRQTCATREGVARDQRHATRRRRQPLHPAGDRLSPRGIPGRVYWFLLRPSHAAALRALARNVVAAG